MEIPIKKNEEYIVEITDNGFTGEGITKVKDFTVFIPNAIKGEKIKILIVKVLSSYAFGKIIEILEKSSDRIESDCTTYKRCGGCSMRHLKYKKTLEIKRNAVQSLVNKTLNKKIIVKETLGMQNPYNYRNKAQYPVGINEKGKAIIGVFANRTHEIIPIDKCLIQDTRTEKIAKYIVKFLNENKISIYDEATQQGIIRHIVIKIGKKTDEIMCVIVINGEKMPKENELVKKLIKKFPEIKTIVKNINTKNTNVILGHKNIVLYGNGYIQDILGDLTFKISPLSFYQVNPIQTEKLYQIGVEAAGILKEDVIFDLYSGIGTISLFMAKHAKKVYGIEIVKEAVGNAKENAELNEIDNVDFINGDVEEVLDDLVNNKNIIPDIVMVDPPRKGLDNKSIDNIIKIKPKKLIYISCNPATLVRDLKKFEESFYLEAIQPVDMFPFTSSIECVAVLYLK